MDRKKYNVLYMKAQGRAKTRLTHMYSDEFYRMLREELEKVGIDQINFRSLTKRAERLGFKLVPLNGNGKH